MAVRCKSCRGDGFSLPQRVTATDSDGMRCRLCGAVSVLGRPWAIVHLAVEGLGLLFSALYSIMLLSAWPLILVMLLAGASRVWLLPALASSRPEQRARRRRISGSR